MPIKEKKVIHVYSRNYGSFFPGNESDEYYFAGWASQVAKNVKMVPDSYKMELWRFEKDVVKENSRIIRGINCRLFPANKFPFIGYFSFNLIRALRKESCHFDVLIHLHIPYEFLSFVIGFVFRKNPIVVSNYGRKPPICIYSETKKIRHYFFHMLFKRVYKYYDYFYLTGKYEREYLKGFIEERKLSNQIGLGVNFEQFKILPKYIAKERIGIAANKKVLIYVGKFFPLKGVDIILECYNNLKSRGDIVLILAGGSEDDPLYHAAKESGALVYLRLDHEHEMPVFLNAADAYLFLNFDNESFLRFGGIGIANLEAMACNTPVISTSLIHFPDDDAFRVGMIPKAKNDVIECIDKVLSNPDQFVNCRKTAIKYYDWSVIAHSIKNTYDHLYQQYFPQ